jgi:hypothetical protein
MARSEIVEANANVTYAREKAADIADRMANGDPKVNEWRATSAALDAAKAAFDVACRELDESSTEWGTYRDELNTVHKAHIATSPRTRR